MLIPAPVQGSSVVDALLVGIIAVVLSIVVGGGLVVEVAALLAGNAFPALSASVIAHGVINWHSFVSAPRLAFPPPLRGQLPGTRLMYTSVAICAAVTLVLATA